MVRISRLAIYNEFLLDELPARLTVTASPLQQAYPLFDCATLSLGNRVARP